MRYERARVLAPVRRRGDGEGSPRRRSYRNVVHAVLHLGGGRYRAACGREWDRAVLEGTPDRPVSCVYCIRRSSPHVPEEQWEEISERYGLVPILLEDKIDGADIAAVPWREVVRALRDAELGRTRKERKRYE